MMNPRWAFIDFDNTLMGTEQFSVPGLLRRFNALYEAQLGRKVDYPEFQSHFHGLARQTLCARMSAHYDFPVVYEDLYKDRESSQMALFQEVEGGIPMAQGALERLGQWKKQGIIPALVTNNGLQMVFSAMRYAANGNGDALAAVFGHRCFSSGDRQKPDPDVYLRALAQLGADASQSIAVEDGPSGVEAAVAAGIRTFGFTGYAHEPEVLAKKLSAKGAVEVFHTWSEMPHFR